MPFVNHRWLGGLLTNFQTISLRIKRLHDLERYEREGQLALLPTRERLSAEADLAKLRANLGGVKNMQRPPDAIFIIDLKTEAIAVREAQRLRIPIIGLVDTNCDPDGVEFVIPGNDDAIRSCAVIAHAIGDVVKRGPDPLPRGGGARAPRGRGARPRRGARPARAARGRGAGASARPRRPRARRPLTQSEGERRPPGRRGRGRRGGRRGRPAAGRPGRAAEGQHRGRARRARQRARATRRTRRRPPRTSPPTRSRGRAAAGPPAADARQRPPRARGPP